MSEKTQMIQRMLELQKKFIEYEHQHGVDGFDYYTPPAGHPLAGFREEYQDLATKVVDIAHSEVGSHRN